MIIIFDISHFRIVITGVSSDCGSVFNGSNDRLTIGLHSRDVLQENHINSGQSKHRITHVGNALA